MKRVTETFYCDICHIEMEKEFKINYPVVFLTEQTEGRTVNPYVQNNTLDVCKSCAETILRVKGIGAQGYNEYSYIDDVQEVKHGKWISTGHGGWHGDMIYRCSVCGNEREAYINEELYCPHCGAKMDGGKRE